MNNTCQHLKWKTNETLGTWWISFVDEETREFQGVCIVKARNHDNAIRLCWYLEINPGGEAKCCRLSQLRDIEPELYWRLLSAEDVEHLTEPKQEQDQTPPEPEPDFNDAAIAKKCGLIEAKYPTKPIQPPCFVSRKEF